MVLINILILPSGERVSEIEANDEQKAMAIKIIQENVQFK